MCKQVKEIILDSGLKGKLKIITRKNETIDIILRDIKDYHLGSLYANIQENEKNKR